MLRMTGFLTPMWRPKKWAMSGGRFGRPRSTLGRPNRPESVAHFLGLLIRAQSPVGMGVIGQNYWVQKPVKEFGPKRAFLDTPDQHRRRLISYCVDEATLMSSQIRIKAQRISFANISDDHLGA